LNLRPRRHRCRGLPPGDDGTIAPRGVLPGHIEAAWDDLLGDRSSSDHLPVFGGTASEGLDPGRRGP
jgi:hypothetical protein